jgi:thymidylate synthase (FAD)
VRIIREPQVYLVGRQIIDDGELERFLADHDVSQWSTDTSVAGEKLCEIAGRVCYLSFATPRPGGNAAYVERLLDVGHGSVLEHSVWSFLITGVSRSFTHELVRHRAGFSYSQLSQRYVDESEASFVEPECVADDPALHDVWRRAVENAQQAYVQLVEGLERRFAAQADPTLRRKLARQAARSVLPNATETKIFVTANTRALRHFIELRANEHAEVEIRRVALKILEIVRQAAPNLFRDYEIVSLDDGTRVARTPYKKV